MADERGVAVGGELEDQEVANADLDEDPGESAGDDDLDEDAGDDDLGEDASDDNLGEDPDEDQEDSGEDPSQYCCPDLASDADSDSPAREEKEDSLAPEVTGDDPSPGAVEDSVQGAVEDDAEGDVEEDSGTTRRTLRSGSFPRIRRDPVQEGRLGRGSRGRGRGRGRGRRKGRSTGGSRGRGRDEERCADDVGDASEAEELDPDLPTDADTGLQLGLRILQDLMNTNSTFLKHPHSMKGMVDYDDVIQTPMWFEEIERRFEDNEYKSIVEFVCDVRLLLLNAYTYFGPNELYTKRALRIEQVLENKISGLPSDLKNMCSLLSTHGIETNENEGIHKAPDFFSYLLDSVSKKREERDKKNCDALIEERLLSTEGRGKEISLWESDILLASPANTLMQTMWEIPLLGHFLKLTFSVLCIDEVPQYEVERIFLMPQASKTLQIIMTSLLSPPLQRAKLHLHPPMPYSTWSYKLAQRVAVWYKLYQTKDQNSLKVFELCGIEKDFWKILGDWNQLEDYEFHELSFHQRIWLVKSLCDYLVHNHKTMQDALADHSQWEQNCEFLGKDRHGRHYLHFPQFSSSPGLCTCVRVYRCLIPDEKARSPDLPTSTPSFFGRTGESGDFMPIWMRGRGRGRGGSRKRNLSKKRDGAEINKRKFLSRLEYRMPRGMYIRGRRKQGRSRALDVPNLSHHDMKRGQVSVSANSKTTLPSECRLSDPEENTSVSISKTSNKCEIRQTRSTRNTSQGFYADWSDSDSSSSSSLSSEDSKKAAEKKSKCEPVTQNVRECISKNIKLASTSTSKEVSLQDSDESEASFSENEQHKSQDIERNNSLHDSGCEDGASRSSIWTTQVPNERDEDCDDDSRDMDDGDQNARILLKKEEADLGIIPWSRDKNRQKRPHFKSDWMLLGAEHFELVADSVQGVRDLIDSLCEEEDVDLSHRLKNSTSSSKPVCEEKLESRLREFLKDIVPLELKIESNARKLRWKLYEEWEEFRKRPSDFKDEAEAHWRDLNEYGVDSKANTTPMKCIQSETVDFKLLSVSELKREGKEEEQIDTPEDDTQTGLELRHSLRTKKPKVDVISSWPPSDDESDEDEEDEELDDSWLASRRRKRGKSKPGRSRKGRISAKLSNAIEKMSEKKCGENEEAVSTDFSFKSCVIAKEPSQKEEDETNVTVSKGPKLHQKLLPNKLTLDKEGNMFITLGCGTKVKLKTDEEGRIIVPEEHEGLSMINGKTLEQLVGSGKVVQNKKRKVNQKPLQTMKRSTTLFPAQSLLSEVVQAKEWTPPVEGISPPILESVKIEKATVGTSIQAKEWTPPLLKGLLNSTVSISQTNSSARSNTSLKTYTNRKKATNPALSIKCVPKKTSEPEEVVVLSDGSDDCIEVIKDTDAKGSKQNGGPRIQSVIGNATLDPFGPKPLTKSVTMIPVLAPKPQSAKKSSKKSTQWSPVISKTVSLDTSASSSSRVPPPGAPEVVITPTRNAPARRNLQQTNSFNQPTSNQSFVPLNSIPMRPAQSQFVPVNQVMPLQNHFQPVAQVLGMNNQYFMANASYPPTNSPFVISADQAYHYIPVSQAPVPMPMQVPMPLTMNACDTGLPPGLTGQIVLANGDNNQFSYAFKLDDGGLIFLSNEQISRIRAANGGKLTTMVQFQIM